MTPSPARAVMVGGKVPRAPHASHLHFIDLMIRPGLSLTLRLSTASPCTHPMRHHRRRGLRPSAVILPITLILPIPLLAYPASCLSITLLIYALPNHYRVSQTRLVAPAQDRQDTLPTKAGRAGQHQVAGGRGRADNVQASEDISQTDGWTRQRARLGQITF